MTGASRAGNADTNSLKIIPGLKGIDSLGNPYRNAMKKLNPIMDSPNISPGTIPAANRPPMESPVVTPISTIRMEGE